ncbi:hypothetical protein [Roseibium aestuarii]|uniref:Uncharacterized protein n=1 Tax=Roseibium aestuarii TaxID=2600299 RepID=A0ABW4JY61_9HYPH|nr:hypothetical protein [Roseibium aestuarii]
MISSLVTTRVQSDGRILHALTGSPPSGADAFHVRSSSTGQ